MSTPTIFKSRVDAWLILVLLGAPLILGSLGVLGLAKSTTAGVLQISFGVLVGVLIAYMSFPCRYTVDDKTLQIRCGVMNEEIPLSDITGAEFSGSLLSAPTLSTKRVKLTLKDGSHRLVSPADREGFIARVTQVRQA